MSSFDVAGEVSRDQVVNTGFGHHHHPVCVVVVMIIIQLERTQRAGSVPYSVVPFVLNLTVPPARTRGAVFRYGTLE